MLGFEKFFVQEDTFKMAEGNTIDSMLVNKVLPPEILEKIFANLDIKSLSCAWQTCKHWKQIIDRLNYCSLQSSCILIAGGDEVSSVKVINGVIFPQSVIRKANLTGRGKSERLGIKQLCDLPEKIRGSSMVLHNGTILLCGGLYNDRNCLQFDNGS